MLALNAIAEKENAAETLLMAKGFADPVVSINGWKKWMIVVNAAVHHTIRSARRSRIL